MGTIEILNRKGIDTKGHFSGQIKTLCPMCSTTRKKKNDPSLSVNLDDGRWNCHHCGWTGDISKQHPIPEHHSVKVRDMEEKYSAAVYDHFEARGIRPDIVNKFQIATAKMFFPQLDREEKCICFDYYLDGQHVNTKFKTKNKEFRMVKGAIKVPYNIDSTDGNDYIIIVEGEEECMVWTQAGFDSVVSCPNGASKTKNNLEWLDVVYDKFLNKKIYIAVDNDDAGKSLRADLIRRFDPENVYLIEYQEKDANDTLRASGEQALQQLFGAAIPVPVPEIVKAEDYYDQIRQFKEEGFPKGISSGTPLDDKITINRKDLVVVHGVPGSGKSTFVDWWSLNISSTSGWKWGMFSPENDTPLKISTMIEQYSGKLIRTANNREMENSMEFINKHYLFYNIPEIKSFRLESILSIAKIMIKRSGIDAVVFDPFSYIENDSGSETQSERIGDFLKTLKLFAVQNDVAVILVAHPRKMDKRDGNNFAVPSAYDISGSKEFFDKPDVIMAAHRDYNAAKGQEHVEIHIQKVKYKWRGEIALVDMAFEPATGRYSVYAQGERMGFRSILHDQLVTSTLL